MELPSTLPPSEKIIVLDPSVSIAGGEIAQIRLREPTANEVWKAEGHVQNAGHPEARTNYVRELVAAVSGISATNLDAVPLSKLTEAHDTYLTLFIDGGLDDVLSPEPNWELELPESITVKGVVYNSLSLREPTTGEVRKAQGQLRKGNGPQSMRSFQLHLATNVADVPFDVIKNLPVSLLNLITSYLSGF